MLLVLLLLLDGNFTAVAVVAAEGEALAAIEAKLGPFACVTEGGETRTTNPSACEVLALAVVVAAATGFFSDGRRS